jgi:hypothetical protein
VKRFSKNKKAKQNMREQGAMFENSDWVEEDGVFVLYSRKRKIMGFSRVRPQGTRCET